MKKATCILLVDDDNSILQVFSQLLRQHGYDVLEAVTGGQGLQMAQEKQPDLVLLDVDLPDVSGVEICRQIKADPHLGAPFVALFSGQATDPNSKVLGLESGADDYLVKPVDLAEFLARIRSLIRLRETTAALRASEARFRQLAEHIRDVFWMTDVAKQEMLYISPGYEVIWGRTCESLYASPRDWVEAIHPEDRGRVLEAAANKQVCGQYDETYRIVRPDGSIRWV